MVELLEVEGFSRVIELRQGGLGVQSQKLLGQKLVNESFASKGEQSSTILGLFEAREKQLQGFR